MTETASARAASYVLTLEEIGHLAAEGGKPAETLMNVVALIAGRFQTDVCSAYLLEPDRANLVLAATLGLRPQCIGTLRMALNEGLAGLVAEQVRPVAVEHATSHPRFKYFSEAGEESYQSFCGVPLIDQGVLQGVLVVQTVEARAFTDDEVQMLVEAAAQVAPVVSEARALDRFIAPVQERLWSLARNLWWSWDNDSTSLFRDLDPVRFRQLNHNPIALLSEIPLAKLERRAGELVLHGRINYAYRRQQEYLRADRTWGATCAGVLRPRPVAYFSAEFGLHESLPIYSGGLGVLAGDHIKSASDLDIPLIGIGLFYSQGYFRQRLDRHGWQQEQYLQTDVNHASHGTGHWQEWRAGGRGIGNSQRHYPGESVARESGPVRFAAAGFERGRQRSRGSRADLAPLRRRWPRSHSPGVAAGRGRISRAQSHGRYPWCSAFE
jgi:starch phosphorylase